MSSPAPAFPSAGYAFEQLFDHYRDPDPRVAGTPGPGPARPASGRRAAAPGLGGAVIRDSRGRRCRAVGPIHGQGRTAGRAGRPGRRIAAGPAPGAGARGAAEAFIRSGCGDVGGGGGAGVWRPSKAGREARANSKRRSISGDGCPPQGPSLALRRRGGPRRRGVALQRPALKLGAWLQCLLAVCVTQRRADCRAWPQARQGPGSLSHNASGAGGRDTTQQSACATPTCEHCQALGSGLPG